MSWLHQLTGFQLWVISSFYDMSFCFAEAKYDRTKKALPVLTMFLSLVIGTFFSIYWIVVAAWPVISG